MIDNRGLQDATVVGKYPNGASPYGVLDMAGNVWEWAADWYDETYYTNSPASNPMVPETGSSSNRVMRGGVWDSDVHFIRSSDRGEQLASDSSWDLGVRCAMSATL